MVPLEGMASAVPFVATDAGAYRAFSAHGEAGAIVDTSEQAANAAQEILSGNVETMGTRAREITCARFSAQAETDGIDKGLPQPFLASLTLQASVAQRCQPTSCTLQEWLRRQSCIRGGAPSAVSPFPTTI